MNSPKMITNHRLKITFRLSRGFALIVTLTLLSLIVIMALTLNSFIRVDTGSSNHNNARSQAEQSALLAMQMAIGQLQQYAGPDQRTTARAEILTGGPSGITPDDSNRHWTGVWRSDDRDPTSPNSRTFLGWLASGPGPGHGLGEVSSSTSDPVRLVSERPGFDGGLVPEVRAGRILSTAGDAGHAWVVMDEGVKAKLNARSWEGTAQYGEQNPQSQFLRMSTSESPKVEVLPALDDFRTLTDEVERERLFNVEGLDFFYTGGDLSERYFHDLTTRSHGVLSDSRNGGLRRDLSRGLGNQFGGTLSGNRVFDGTALSDFPLFWDSVAAYANLYQLLGGSAFLPTIDPRATVPSDLSGGRVEFNDSAISTVPLVEGGVSGWNINHHPIAPVVQQVIWRIGGFGADYNVVTVRDPNTNEIIDYVRHPNAGWDWRDGTPEEEKSNTGRARERWGELRRGRQNVAPLVVLWNPYNVTIDVSNYRVTYNPSIDMQIVARNPITGDTHNMIPGAFVDLVRKWQGETSSTTASNRYSGHFTVEIFNEFRREDVVQPNQTLLAPGEMKIFGLRFIQGTGGWVSFNAYGGGFGRWTTNEPVPLSGPTNGDPHKTFWASVSSRGTSVTHTHMDWIHDYMDLNVQPNTTDDFRPNDFRLTLTLSETGTVQSGGSQGFTGNPNVGYVVRDVWGLRPPASDSGRFFFTETWGNADTYYVDEGHPPFITLWAYFRISRQGNLEGGSEIGDLKYAANLVARLNTGQEVFGSQTVPFMAHFNPLAWHARPGHPDEVSSPLWDVRLMDRNQWQDYKGFRYNSAVGRGIATYGNSIDDTGQQRVVLKEIPRQPLFSVGQLMHADIGVYDTVPLYTVGGSYAPPFGSRTQVQYGSSTSIDGSGTNLEAIDLSWYFNELFFDGWFFSTVPNPGQSTSLAPFEEFNLDFVQNRGRLPNSRMIYYNSGNPLDEDYFGRLTDINTASASLLTSGSFNINSTSVDAWKAVLSSLRQSERLRYSQVIDDNSTSESNLEPSDLNAPLPRFLNPMGSTANADNHADQDAWSGIRSLSDTEVDELARAIVEEVQRRGPFRTIAEFVNRQLADNEFGRSGALQAALDRTVNRAADFGGEATRNQIWGSSVNWDNHAPASSAGATGWVLQNDILQFLAPVMSARSDTFRIRTYGSAINPDTGDTDAEAWAEVVVQRVPDWMDDSEAPELTPNIDLNLDFGRRFVIVDFRWLTEAEL